MGMMKLGNGGVNEMSADMESPSPSPSPTSVMDSGRAEVDVDCMVNRVSLPKSISVRSNGYLRTVQSGAGSSNDRNQKRLLQRPWIFSQCLRMPVRSRNPRKTSLLAILQEACGLRLDRKILMDYKD